MYITKVMFTKGAKIRKINILANRSGTIVHVEGSKSVHNPNTYVY